MTTTGPRRAGWFHRLPPRAAGPLLAGGAVFAVMAAGAVLGPFASSGSPPALRAQPGLSGARTPTPPEALLARGEPRFLGEMLSPAYRVLVFAYPDGPRYTVCDARGRILGERLTPEEVSGEFPGLDVQTLRFGPDEGVHANEPLMLAPHAERSPEP